MLKPGDVLDLGPLDTKFYIKKKARLAARAAIVEPVTETP